MLKGSAHTASTSSSLLHSYLAMLHSEIGTSQYKAFGFPQELLLPLLVICGSDPSNVQVVLIVHHLGIKIPLQFLQVKYLIISLGLILQRCVYHLTLASKSHYIATFP
ncbi:hypothetical protein FRX31_020704 [Thalictrum thalictroides]|uniref:Uncharacterized protein n=1 Tax=Thalictrum thalictroides TaxID=46969 RepID=A0A7J6VZT5_THATH|nr:hypothetical protein FRX31_020704 [Thalictrum thalictroides]